MKTSKLHRIALLTILLVLALSVLPGASAYAEAVEKDETSASVTVPIEEKALLELLLEVKELAQKVHPSDVSVKTLYQGMIKGLMESLGDQHTEYLTEDEYVRFTTSLNGTYSGIGVVLQVIEGKIIVVSTIKGGPAERAGVKPGDIITTVDGKEYSTMNDVATALRGDAGTSVIVTVSRPSTGEFLSFGLYRELLSPSPVEAEHLGDGLYYIRIAQFDAGIGMTFGDEMDRIKGLGAKGLVLDLRDNPGGLLDVGVEVAEHLVPKGPILEVQGKTNRQIVFGDVDTKPIPVVVLVNGRSASASEIVAGAVRDYGIGILVGERTYGKGSIQQVIPLGDELGALRLTIANYFTPSGAAINGVGLQPDIVVTSGEIPARLEYKRPLSLGTVGLDVLALQNSLAFVGYYSAEADGVYGPRTAESVRRLLEDRRALYPGSVGSAEIDEVNAAVIDKVSNSKDAVYTRALEALKSRIQTGAWLAAPQQ